MIQMPKQSTRFYRKDERNTNDDYGLKTRADSGANWVNKLDGENDHMIASIKSTEKASFSIKFADLHELEYQALVANKLPIFLVKDLTSDKRYLIIEESNLPDTAKHFKYRTGPKTAETEAPKEEFVVPKRRERKVIAAPNSSNIYNRYQGKKESAY